MKSHWRFLYGLLPKSLERKMYERHFKKANQAWLSQGSPLPVSNLLKQQVLADFQQQYNLKIFVETGTYMGDTLYALYPYFEKLYSIELSDAFYARAQKRFKTMPRVTLLKGDSGKVLQQLLPTLNTTAIFWLDAHYSGGITAKGDKECPIYEELSAIFNSPLSHHIFIDDARLFVGTNDYPTLEELQEFVKQKNAAYTFSVQNDCIRLLPL